MFHLGSLKCYLPHIFPLWYLWFVSFFLSTFRHVILLDDNLLPLSSTCLWPLWLSQLVWSFASDRICFPQLFELRRSDNVCLVWFLLIYADASAAFGVSQDVEYTHMHVNMWKRHQSLVLNIAVRTWNNRNFSLSVVKPLKINRTAALLQINCLFGLVCSFHTFILSVSLGAAPRSLLLTPALQDLLTLHPCSLLDLPVL